MKHFSDLEYLKLTKAKRFGYRLASFFAGIPKALWNFVKKIGSFFKNIGVTVASEAKDIVTTFVQGDWKTKLSYLVMGFGCLARGQILRGLLFLLFEIVFIVYMIFAGGYWLKMLPSLGLVGPHEEYDMVLDTYTSVYGDNSFKILLYGVLTIFFIIAFIYTWRVNVKQNKIAEQILATGKKLKSGKDDLRSLVDDQFHKTLLALPMTGIIVFTVMPIVFMILVAFTNYDGFHDGYYNNLFDWVGLTNFRTMLTWTSSGVNYAATFGEILTWTLIWAFFATFTNYFLGMLVAMAINKKGIRLKKMWRTILVMTIAIPQFISLLYVSKMFAKNGIVNWALMSMHLIDKALPFWEDPTWARVLVIIINIWIGIPYLMLIATGILMNIPADLYESARIDGAGKMVMFRKITLPYIMFVMGPYLITQFIGNINNFNIIYLLTGGAPFGGLSDGAGGTSLLVTWLYSMTGNGNYKLASTLGILTFLVCSIVSLITYRNSSATKNEEDFG